MARSVPRAAAESGPLLTAAAAYSSWARSEQPICTVDMASPVIAKRIAASMRLPAWPWATRGWNTRARVASVA